MEGISNETIVDFFENETDNDLKKKLCQCFSVQLRPTSIQQDLFPFMR